MCLLYNTSVIHLFVYLQFPSYDMKTFATPRRVEQEDGVDIFEYGKLYVRCGDFCFYTV